MLDYGEIVGDEDQREAHFPLQFEQQVDDLGLDGHVEGRYRLIANDEARFQRDGAGDADALPLAAGELVGEAVLGGGFEADAFQKLGDPAAAFCGRAQVVDDERFFENLADGVAGVPGIRRGPAE